MPARTDQPLFRPLSRSLVALAVLIASLILAAPTARAQGITAAEVQRAIDGGVQFLRKNQQADGSWPEYPGQSCGLTALCTLAMLNCGIPADDPAIRKAMRYLRSDQPETTYSVSLQTLVFCQLGSATDLGAITRNVKWLEESQLPAGDWTYQANSNVGRGDPSNAQFAILALGAAEDRGLDVDPEVFVKAQKYWLSAQKTNGGWAYDSGLAKGSMTCAGIASLVICRGHLPSGDSRIENGQVVCCGGDDPPEDDPIERGMNWLAQRFSTRTHPGARGSSSQFYYLYALERVGRMTGRRFIGRHDWYREGAEYLVSVQDQFENRWKGQGFGETDPNVTTSFALLFLAKGKRQVVIGRLRHPTPKQPGDWQRHAGGLQQLVRHVQRDWGRDLTWQTVELEGASVEDLLQAPVLVISGQNALAWSDQQAERIKSYVDQGGFLVFEANAGSGCGDATAFQQSVQQQCQQWFPSAELKKLPPGHPVWTAEGRVRPADLGNDFWMYGVQACCRTTILYSPISLTCRWELSDPTGRRRPADEAVRRETASATQLGQNILAYATGRELKDKLDQRSILTSDFEDAAQRNVLRIPRLNLDAGGEEASRALPNLTALLREEFPVRVVPVEEDVPLDAEKLELYPILWVHGRSEFSWTDAERQQLRNYILRGGVVIADSICGSDAFAKAFRREWAAVMPDSPLKPMPADHPAMTKKFGYDLSNVTLRQPTQGPTGTTIVRRQGTPPLEFATQDGFAVCYLSPYDLSCALESPNSIQCPGYETADAAKIGINLILYTLQQ